MRKSRFLHKRRTAQANRAYATLGRCSVAHRTTTCSHKLFSYGRRPSNAWPRSTCAHFAAVTTGAGGLSSTQNHSVHCPRLSITAIRSPPRPPIGRAGPLVTGMTSTGVATVPNGGTPNACGTSRTCAKWPDSNTPPRPPPPGKLMPTTPSPELCPNTPVPLSLLPTTPVPFFAPLPMIPIFSELPCTPHESPLPATPVPFGTSPIGGLVPTGL